MKTRQIPPPIPSASESPRFPDEAALAALRAWYAGLSSRAAVEHYLTHAKAPGQSARGILGRIRRQVIAFAQHRQRDDLADLLRHPVSERLQQASAVGHAIESLRSLPAPEPRVTDDIGLWLAPRAVRALRAHGIQTLADLTVRVPRRRRWWSAIPDLGQASARHIEDFFAEHPQLTERAPR